MIPHRRIEAYECKAQMIGDPGYDPPDPYVIRKGVTQCVWCRKNEHGGKIKHSKDCVVSRNKVNKT